MEVLGLMNKVPSAVITYLGTNFMARNPRLFLFELYLYFHYFYFVFQRSIFFLHNCDAIRPRGCILNFLNYVDISSDAVLSKSH